MKLSTHFGEDTIKSILFSILKVEAKLNIHENYLIKYCYILEYLAAI